MTNQTNSIQGPLLNGTVQSLKNEVKSSPFISLASLCWAEVQEVYEQFVVYNSFTFNLCICVGYSFWFLSLVCKTFTNHKNHVFAGRENASWVFLVLKTTIIGLFGDFMTNSIAFFEALWSQTNSCSFTLSSNRAWYKELQTNQCYLYLEPLKPMMHFSFNKKVIFMICGKGAHIPLVLAQTQFWTK